MGLGFRVEGMPLTGPRRPCCCPIWLLVYHPTNTAQLQPAVVPICTWRVLGLSKWVISRLINTPIGVPY